MPDKMNGMPTSQLLIFFFMLITYRLMSRLSAARAAPHPPRGADHLYAFLEIHALSHSL